jgi:hypothetical protein
MNNQRPIALWLAWLCSNRLFAAVLLSSTSTTSCSSLNQSQCEIETSGHANHFLRVISSLDSIVDDENNASIINDYCGSMCSLLSSHINNVMPLKVTHATFVTQLTVLTVKAFSQNIFRVPGLAYIR